jgi:NAD(P)-dependent dehydrogenase (short-subunit alcohol dehydrogenase family)
MRDQSCFDLSGRVAVITGGAGLLGRQHASAIAEFGGKAVLADLDEASAQSVALAVAKESGGECMGIHVDITSRSSVEALRKFIIKDFGKIDILINNAANNPKIETNNNTWTRLENFPENAWDQDMNVGLKGAFFCAQAFGTEMARCHKGVILNISSDLGIIAPDQRIYRKDGMPDETQLVKPVTYSVVKHGLIGLTKYLATYWADKGIRVNSLSPGGVFNGQDEDFVRRLANLIPMGRMAKFDEYKGAIVFLCSDASSYMTGANLSIDGGRTAW